MYLSELALDPMGHRAMRLLTDIYLLHQAVMSGFEAYNNQPRVLFRVEPEVMDKRIRLLVQSSVIPSWQLFSERYGELVDARTKEFSHTVRAGDTFRFRLRANPTVKRDGKRYGLVREDALEEWLRKKERRLGMRLRSLLVVDEGYGGGHTKKGESQQRLNLKMVRFEGFLSVTEPSLLLQTLSDGIGPAKAFGCGLLSLARVR